MASEWAGTTLGNVVKLQSGGTPAKSNPSFWKGDIPWLSAKDMKSFRVSDTEEHVTKDALASGSRIAAPGTVFLLVRGMTLHNDVPMCVAGTAMAFNQDVKAISVSDPALLPEYLPYLLLGNKPALQNMVDSAGHGTGRLNSDELRALRVRLPSLEEQRLVAGLFRVVDDKIEQLLLTNQLMKAIARAIFKSWFVDFDPVRAKAEGREPEGMDAATAALFPKALHKSDIGLTPEGWSCRRVDDVSASARDTLNPARFENELFQHYSLPAYDEGRRPKLEFGREIKSNKTLIPAGAVLLSKLNPHIPRIWLPDPASGHRAISSTEFLGFVGISGVSPEWLFCQFSEQTFLQAYGGLTTGTSNSHQRVKLEYLNAHRVIVPSQGIMDAFTEIARSLFRKVQVNINLQKTLAELRDTLLPRLISGNLRMPDAEELVEAVL